MLRIDKRMKDGIVDIIRRGLPKILPAAIAIEKSCLFHAEATRQVIESIIESGKLQAPGEPKSRVMLQAGTHQWMRVRPEEDDGKIATHFTYEWQGGSLVQNFLHATMGDKGLPEMHVWCAIMTPNHKPQVIDLTTRYLPDQCRNAGMSWTAANPPDYLWCFGHEVPKTARYIPNKEATELAYALIGQCVVSYNPLLGG